METDDLPSKRDFEHTPQSNTQFSTEWRPFKQRRILHAETLPAPAPFVFDGFSSGGLGGGGYPGSFGGGNGSGAPSFGAPFQGFGGAPFQGFGEGGGGGGGGSGGVAPGGFGGSRSAFGIGAQQLPPGLAVVARASASPPRRSVNDVLMGAQRAAVASSAAAATSAAEAAAAPKAVAFWGGVAVGMAPRARGGLLQCHVCRCMLDQPPGGLAAATSAAVAAAAAAPVVGRGGAACSCAHCELATCPSCACSCSGCGGRFCLFCAGTSYLGRYEETLCGQCHERSVSEHTHNGGDAAAAEMEDG